MARKRDVQRKPISRTEVYENPLDYFSTEESPDLDVSRRSLQQSKQSSRSNRRRAYDNEENEQEYEDNRTVNGSVKNTPRDYDTRTVSNGRQTRRKSHVKAFEDEVGYIAKPKIDSHNEHAINPNRRRRKIFSEKLIWQAKPKIDSHNEEVVQTILRTPRKQIYDEKLFWSASVAIDAQNDEFIQHKQREQVLKQREGKSRVQSYPGQRIKANKSRIDNYNPEYVEYKRKQSIGKLPPIEIKKPEWKNLYRLSPKKDLYIQSVRDTERTPIISQEKIRKKKNTPRNSYQSVEYFEKLKDESDRSPRSITPYSESRSKPTVVDEIPRWKRRTKTDYDSDYSRYEDEYID